MIIEPLLDTIQLLDISDETYFGDNYKDYISNSRLKLINPDEGGSPEIFKKGLSSQYSDSLYFGSAVHELILQPDDFYLASEVNRPTAKAGFMADELYPIFIKNNEVTINDIVAASNKIGYYKDKLDSNKIEALRVKCEDYFTQRRTHECKVFKKAIPIYLDYNSQAKLKDCIKSVKKNKHIQNLLHPEDPFENPLVMNEGTLLMDVKVKIEGKIVILKLKAKLDTFTFNKNDLTLVLNDLKTTGHFVNKFDESFQRYHYYRQVAMYDWMLRCYILKEYNKIPTSNTANMLVVSTIPEYYSKVYKVKESEIRKGFKEFVKLLKLVAYCEIHGYN